MPAIASIDFATLLKGVPPGAWVAISSDRTRVVAIAFDVQAAIAEAKAQGENHPMITRAPSSPSMMVL